MTAPDPDLAVGRERLAAAEEWARWAAVHDDWDKTRELMGVLLGEYDRRREVLDDLAERLLNADAEAIARQATFMGMTVEEGALALNLGPPRELVIAWVDAARKMLGDAENYSETRIDFPAVSMELKAAGEVERYVFTVQRAGKVTPHEARRGAEADLATARDRIAALLARCDQQEKGHPAAHRLTTRAIRHYLSPEVGG
jgi:hypothetical protein